GRISLPELESRGYDKRIAIGSLAGAGTLGLLIPPSIVMIVYAVAAQVSIIRMFIAGILPGILLMALFSGYIGLWSLRYPDRIPQDNEDVSLKEKLYRRSKSTRLNSSHVKISYAVFCLEKKKNAINPSARNN